MLKQPKTVRIVVTVLTMLYAVTVQEAVALSNYGRSCAGNSDCVTCKQDIQCLTCLHDCYNMYGVADTIPGQKIDRHEYCKKKQAKWCSAQCWDPDETDEDDYKSTKPLCRLAF